MSGWTALGVGLPGSPNWDEASGPPPEKWAAVTDSIKYALNTCYVSGVVPGAGDAAKNKPHSPCPK